MQSHRVFVAINFPDKIKEKMWLEANKFSDLPLRITKQENVHLTLVFIGYVDNDELIEIINTLPDIASRHNPFELKLDHLAYGPDEKHSRMIWMKGPTSEELLRLQGDITKTLGGLNLRSFRLEKRPFTVHVTLARMKEERWRDWENKPKIEEKKDFAISVGSIELMGRSLKRGGAEYSVLQSFQFGSLY